MQDKDGERPWFLDLSKRTFCQSRVVCVRRYLSLLDSVDKYLF